MKNDLKIFILLFLIIGIASLGYFLGKGDNSMKNEEVIDGGVVKDRILPGYKENIKSKNIIKFEYNGEFKMYCELNEDGLHVKSTGGSSYYRDGTYFKLDYIARDDSLLSDLQDIIDKYGVTKNNGYEHETAGLPEGLGDYISVLYDSGEKIWKSSNQSHTIGDDAINAIYNAFKKCANDNNLDFTSDSSNTTLYNDATLDYLQGTWKGSHFGREYIVIFSDNNVKIYEDGNLVDDTTFTIIDGHIVKDKLKDGITNAKDYHDHEEFSVISIMAKKNDFTLIAYFMKNSYSTSDLFKQS